MYKKMYYHLFNAVSDAIERMDKGQREEAREGLIKAQQEAEDLYIGREHIPETAKHRRCDFSWKSAKQPLRKWR